MPDISADDNEVDENDDTEVVDGPENSNSPDSELLKLAVVDEACLESSVSVESDLKNMGSKGINY